MTPYRKYLTIGSMSFRRRRREKAVLLGRIAFYTLVLLVFSKLWQSVFAAELARGAAPPASRFGDYVWYLVITEWIVLSQPSVHLEVQSDVQNGDIAYQLGRPVSYIGTKLCEGLGDLALRLIVLGAAGLVLGRLFAGYWPNPSHLLLASAVGVLASVLLLSCLLSIGLSAFWLHDCMPVYMVWQKLVFVLGGLMLPLSIWLFDRGLRRYTSGSRFAPRV